jgi:DNA-binding winged helix-turn-helix (wHTH) protein
MKRFKSFRLDTANQCLWCGEARADLTPKAFDVLRYLVEHAGQLVTSDELLEAIWPGTYINPEGLRKYIQEIRKVLGDRPDEPVFIETMPKRGYQFVAAVAEEGTAGLPDLPSESAKRIVGREPALADLERCLDKAVRGERQIVFVTGEPGIGKTTLVDEFQRRAAGNLRSLRVARGQCVEGYGGKEAYYPMLEALGQLCHGAGRDSIIDTLATQAPTWLVQFPALVKPEHRERLQREILGATRERMLREINEALEAFTSEKPVMFVLEDLQWVDDSTVDLISALARRRTPANLMLVGTYRPVDLIVLEHPLKKLKQDLHLHHLCREIALQPLEESAVAEYLAAELGGAAVPEGLAALVYRRTEGNPLFMVTVLQHMRERNLIAEEGGGLRLVRPPEEIELIAPESLRQMIEMQVERMSSEEQRALEAASVAGVTFSTAVTVSAADMDVERFENLCEALSVRHQMVRLADPQEFPDGTASDRYEFAHVLYREVLYRRQSPVRRAKLHLRVGERLEVLYNQWVGEAAGELAHHFEQGKDWPRAIKYLQLAADTAGRRFEPQRALEILEHALELKNRLPEGDRTPHEISILERLATIHITFVGARALLEKAWHVILKNSQGYPQPVERAIELSAEFKDPLLGARTVMRWSLCNVWDGDWNGKYLDDCGRALEVIRQRGSRLIVGSNLMDYGVIRFFSSQYRSAYQNVREGLSAIIQESENKGYLKGAFIHEFVVPWSLLFLGEWGEALDEINRRDAMMDRNTHSPQARTSRLYRAFVYSFAQDFAGVLQICEPILPLLEASSDIRFCSILMASAEVNLGNYQRAHTLLSSAQQDMERRDVMLDWYRRILLESVFTELWLAKGDVIRARPEAERFLKTASATEERTWRTLAWEASARLAFAERDLTKATNCIAEGLHTMEGFEAPLARWRLNATAFELYQALGNRDLAERHRALSLDTIMKLANSLPAGEPLQDTFLSAPRVRKVLGESKSAVSRAKDIGSSGY